MTGPISFRAAREAAGLSINGMAKRYGLNPTTVRDWNAGEKPAPQWIMVALNDLRQLQKEAHR